MLAQYYAQQLQRVHVAYLFEFGVVVFVCV